MTSRVPEIEKIAMERTYTREEVEQMIESLEYESKLSRKYFSANWDPQKAHKNGYRLAVRELTKLIGDKDD